ncbi:MAG: RsmE family RNA methyltransferase [Candidatus Peregrinibacteria bacterium]
MHRFYIPSLDLTTDTVSIVDPHRVHQIARVLRMRPGELLSVFDGRGEEREIKILEVTSHQVLGQRLERLIRRTEPSVQVSLYQAIPKKTALFEWVVEKATELGVSAIYPLITERTEKRRMSKFERLERIAIESTEQCNRLRVPLIHHPISFETAFLQAKNGYLAYEFEEGMDLLDYGKALMTGNALQLFIGPEGGFSQKEVNAAKKAGIKIYSLGSRILRTETAAIASLSQLLPLIR